jgi:hypothetical protein
MAVKKQAKKMAPIAEEIVPEVDETQDELKMVEIELFHIAAGTHTIFTQNLIVHFTDGKATVRSDVADQLRKSGYIK